VVIAFEERVFEQIIEHMENAGGQLMQSVLVINLGGAFEAYLAAFCSGAQGTPVWSAWGLATMTLRADVKDNHEEAERAAPQVGFFTSIALGPSLG
jgi:L-alanine-DL-glutamate epimerase-like enolase superfamily enzyme